MPTSDNQFDDQVRAALTDPAAAPAPSPGDWDRLRARLDGTAGTSLDDQLRHALDQPLTGGVVGMGWEQLSNRLTTDVPVSADQNIAQRLNDLRPTYDPASWDRLKRRLDNLNAEHSAQLDHAVREQLTQSVHAVPSGWAMLAARLELIGARRQMIAALKITEIALLASLLLSFLRFGELPRDAVPTPALAAEFPVEVRVAASNDSVVKSQDEKSSRTVIDPLADELYPSVDMRFRRATTRVAKAERIPPQSSADTPGVSPPEAADTSESLLAEPSKLAITPLLQLPTSPIARVSLPPAPALSLTPPSPIRLNQVSIGVYISPFDFNHIKTEAQTYRGTDTEIEGGEQLSFGTSGGVFVHRTMPKSWMTYGAAYLHRSYVPADLQQRTASPFEPFGAGYSRMIYQTLSLSVNYGRELVSVQRWRIGAEVGMALGVNFDNRFHTAQGMDRFIERLREASRNASSSQQGEGRSQPSWQLYEVEPGVLQGGRFLDNARLSVQGALVIERSISPRTTLYLSPQVARTLYIHENAGLGPYLDRLHSNSIRLGTRFQLTKAIRD